MSQQNQANKSGKNLGSRQTGDMKKISIAFGLFLIGTLISTQIWAATPDTAGGLSFISDGNAEAAALGNAFTAVPDNIAGLVYNPASAATLTSGQASFLFQRGLIEDSYGQLMIGTPLHNNSGLGLTVGYYNAGSIDCCKRQRRNQIR